MKHFSLLPFAVLLLLSICGCSDGTHCEICRDWELQYQEEWLFRKQSFSNFMDTTIEELKKLGYTQVHFRQGWITTDSSRRVYIFATRNEPYTDDYLSSSLSK